MKIASFFSGIGGLELGLERALDGETVFQCERDPYAVQVLEKHWPGVPRHDDITTLRPEDIPAADVWCGGFPCQDISLAGKGEGLDGDRSGLWWAWFTLILLVRPRAVVLENVAALRVRGLDDVLRALAEAWFDVEWDTVGAWEVGAPHKRNRMFLIAIRRDAHGFDEAALARARGGTDSDAGRDCVPDAVCNELRDEQGGQRGARRAACAAIAGHDSAQGAVADAEGIRRGQGRSRRTVAPGEVRSPEGKTLPDADGRHEQHEREGTDGAPNIRAESRRPELRPPRRRAGSGCEAVGEVDVPDPDGGGQQGERERGLLDGERAALGHDPDGRDRAAEVGNADGARLEVRHGCNGSRPVRAAVEPGWWSTEPDVRGVLDGLPTRLDGGVDDAGDWMGACGREASMPRERVLGVWLDEHARASSSGRGSDEQLARELGDALPELSHRTPLESGEDPLAQASRIVQRLRSACEASGPVRDAPLPLLEAWSSLPREAQARVLVASLGRASWPMGEWLGVPRVATGVPARVDRLRCLGNAVVPAVAYVVGLRVRAILDARAA